MSENYEALRRARDLEIMNLPRLWPHQVLPLKTRPQNHENMRFGLFRWVETEDAPYSEICENTHLASRPEERVWVRKTPEEAIGEGWVVD